MKFNLFVLPTVPGTLEDREKLRPIGRNNERFQMMLDEVRALAILADDFGFDSFSTTEHHFHSEGYEASVAPLILYADLAARTKNIKFSPMALVLPAHNPLRVAEELAYLDHLTKGRVYAGFARGYQQRWVNVLGQKVPVEATPMDGGDIDKHNRRVHEEYIELIYKAWAEDLLTFDGEFIQVPYPYKGIEGWPNPEWTSKYGAPGEIDDQGVLRGISVIPKPYQQPHPHAFQPFSVSESTIVHTAKNDITPMILVSNPPDFSRLCETYQRVAGESGRDLKLGEGVGAFRSIAFGDTEQEAVSLLERTNYFGFNAYFAGFGFWEAFRLPDDPAGLLQPKDWTMDRFRKVKYGLAGTVDQVKRDIEDVHTIHGRDGELEWFSWFFDQGLLSMDDAKRQMEIFAEHIMPDFR
jgi:alkanesulfonate monooxygenase SsuD/methylene tetrahydromethanopterin reductase-like flavin-dependent oxidoreductase (luciferase family)